MWNVVGIILPLIQPGFYQPFSNIPYVFYSEDYYSGEDFDETQPDHKFIKEFNKNSGIFYHETSIVIVLILVLLTQIVFYAFVVKLYRRLKLANYFIDENDALDMENLKEL